MRRLLLFLFLVFMAIGVFPEKIAEFTDLATPRCLLMDKQDIIIADKFDILVYSRSDFKLKTKFGKKGEGPGEFLEAPAVQLLPDGTIQAFSFNKYCVFSKTGQLLKNVRVAGTIASMIMDVYGIRNNYLLTRRLVIDNKNALLAFTIADPELKEIKEFYRTNYDVSIPAATGFKELKMINYLIDVQFYQDKIFIADAQKGFYFQVFDSEGNLAYTIQKDYPKIKVDEDYKKNAGDYFIANQRQQWERFRGYGMKFTFYEDFPPIFCFRVIDGKMYVITYLMQDGKHEMLILNLKGDQEKRLLLPLKSLRFYEINAYNRYKPFLIKENQLYELYENEDNEIWEFQRTDLSKVK